MFNLNTATATLIAIAATTVATSNAIASEYRVTREQGWGQPDAYEIHICASKPWSLRDRDGNTSGVKLAPGECILVPKQADNVPAWAIQVQGASGRTWYLAATAKERNVLYTCDLALIPLTGGLKTK